MTSPLTKHEHALRAAALEAFQEQRKQDEIEAAHEAAAYDAYALEKMRAYDADINAIRKETEIALNAMPPGPERDRATVKAISEGRYTPYGPTTQDNEAQRVAAAKPIFTTRNAKTPDPRHDRTDGGVERDRRRSEEGLTIELSMAS